MKKIIYFLFLFAAFNVNAKEISVTAYGEGEDYDWAVMNAVENAVRQTSEITVESDGMHKLDVSAKVEHGTSSERQIEAHDRGNVNAYRQDGIIPHNNSLHGEEHASTGERTSSNEFVTAHVSDNSKEIMAKYKGAISSYEVLEHTIDNGKHKVKIRATIFKEDVYDSHDYKSKDLIKKAKYSLAIMPFKMAPKISCLGNKPDAKEINTTISNLFIEELAPSRKFTLVDRNNLDDYAAEMAIIEGDMTLPENKVKLKNLAAADYILSGTVDNFMASTSKSYVELTGETNYSSSSKLKISYRILEAATMEIVSAGSVEKTFSKDGAFSSCTNVEELLFGRAIDEAAEKILVDIFPDYRPVKKTETKKPVKKTAPASDYSLPLY